MKNKAPKMILIHVYMVMMIMNYCGGFVMMSKQDMLLRHNNSQVQRSSKADFRKLWKLKLAIHDVIDFWKKISIDNVNNKIEDFKNDNFNNKTGNFDNKGKLSMSKLHLNESILQQNETGLKPDEVFYISADGFSYYDGNLTQSELDFPSIIKKLTIGDKINDTEANNTLDFPLPGLLEPDCTAGAGNCSKCQDLSPYCHYMYSEKKCTYFSHAHASKYYECGVRWFAVQRHEAFFATAVLTFIVSSGLCGYMILLRMKLSYDPEIDTDYEKLRRAVEKIRGRRLPESVSDDTHLVPQDTNLESQ